MKKVKTFLVFIIFGVFLLGCSNSQSESTESSVQPPIQENDESRYNLNQPDESVIKLDSTTEDTSAISKRK